MDIDGIASGAGGGGLIGTVLTYLGFKSRVDRIEQNAVSKDTFDATIIPMQKDISEIKNDVKALLNRSRNGRNGDKN